MAESGMFSGGDGSRPNHGLTGGIFFGENGILKRFGFGGMKPGGAVVCESLEDLSWGEDFSGGKFI